ncbi:hypothetical protein [uncultured Pelagimonas sp.]|uniref:hypothetical protein n=1 Tax=uncultured Pelagimonas sp. TaxID=1618102 RepID=UPI0026307668|nr:hypothetical protein [uncultured Pelagimonas sp.]
MKSRIIQSRKFVFLATKNSKESKWSPWELGLTDGNKSLRNIALLPALEDDRQDSWTDWEYLGLNDRIVRGKIKGRPKDEWLV